MVKVSILVEGSVFDLFFKYKKEHGFALGLDCAKVVEGVSIYDME